MRKLPTRFMTWALIASALGLALPAAAGAQTASNGFSYRTITDGEMGMRGRKAIGPFDIDSDGFGEFIVLAGDFTNGGAVKILEATANNTYAERASYSISESLWNIHRALAFGDVDGDAVSEIVLGYYPRIDSVTAGTSVIRVLEVNPSTFAISENAYSPVPTPSADPLEVAILGDTDGDSRPEFVVTADNSPEVQIYEWNGSNGWTIVASFDAPGDARTMEIGDTDNDAINEIVVAGDEVFAIYKFSGGSITSDGTISNGVPANSNEIVDRIAIGDIDNNGVNEIVLGYHDDNGVVAGGLLVFENTGGTNYNRDAVADSGVQRITTNELVLALAIGDFDNDGKSEIFWSDAGNDDFRYIEFNNGGGAGDFAASRFDAPVSIFSPFDPTGNVADALYISGGNQMLDGDLFRDIVLMTRDNTNQKEIHLIESDTQDSSLPVELTSFAARLEGGHVVLEWVTESEVDNLGYILDRRLQGTAGWHTLASYTTHQELRGQGSVPSRTEYAFTDATAETGTTYEYRLADVSVTGRVTYHPILSILVGAGEGNPLPEGFRLVSAFPNPFNPETNIAYELGDAARVHLEIFNALGQPVSTLVQDEIQSAGSYFTRWNATLSTGRPAPSGAYFAVLRVGDRTETLKLLLVR